MRTAAPLLAASAVAWLAVAAYEPPMGAAAFLVGWTLMMAAMMLPSILPLAALLPGGQVALAAGYLSTWAATGLVPWEAMEHGLSPALPLVLAAAGAYELTPLKAACLRRCRNPVGFATARAGGGRFRLGVEHGLWCVGCCVGLMVVLVLAAAMSLAAAAILGAVVFVQKALPLGETSARLTGVVLLATAAAVAMA